MIRGLSFRKWLIILSPILIVVFAYWATSGSFFNTNSSASPTVNIQSNQNPVVLPNDSDSMVIETPAPQPNVNFTLGNGSKNVSVNLSTILSNASIANSSLLSNGTIFETGPLIVEGWNEFKTSCIKVAKLDFENNKDVPMGWYCGFANLRDTEGAISRTTDSHDGHYAVNITMTSTSGSLYSYYKLPALSAEKTYKLTFWAKSSSYSRLNSGIQQLNTWNFAGCKISGSVSPTWKLYSCEGKLARVDSDGYIIPIVLEARGTLVWDNVTFTEDGIDFVKFDI